MTVYNYLKILLESGYDIDLICFEDRKNPKVEVVNEFQRKLHVRRTYVIYIPSFTRYLGAVLSYIRGDPLQIGYFFNFYTQGKLRGILKELGFRYDFIFIHTIRLSEFVKHFPFATAKRKILFYADSIAMNYYKALEYNKSIGIINKLIYIAEKKRLKQYEIDILKEFDVGVFHSKIDVDYLNLSNNHKIKVIPIARERARKYIPITERTKRRFLFIGNFKSIPNRLAVDFLIKSFNPIEKSKYKFQIDLIGPEMPNVLLKKIKANPFLRYIGTVENINREIIDSLGAICPIEVGAGMQNKILDAITNGRPVVSSVYSALPYYKIIGKTKNTGILSFTNKSEMKKFMKKIVEDLDFANVVGIQAYETSKEFSLEKLRKQLLDIFKYGEKL